MTRRYMLTAACSLALLVTLLAACSGGGGGDSASESSAVIRHTIWHANGQKAAEGLGYMVDGEVVRHGEWTDWFEDSTVWRVGVYVDGVKASPWVEYNQDSSVRFHWTDY